MIDQLIDRAEGVQHPEIIREMILTALKAGQESNGNRSDLKMMNTTLKEMRFTAKVFSSYRNRKKVTVFGSARAQPESSIYRMARLFGRKLSESGYMVITGGGSGIMQAVNEGAGAEHSFGVAIRLPFESPNPVLEGSPRNIMYKYFFNRKVAFLKEADAVVLFPGGFGTLDEGMETITLVQTGKRYPLPVILIDEPGGTYWSQWIRFLEEELLARGYISPCDFHIFNRVDSVEEAVRNIDRFYSRYHSVRFVGGQLVIRLTSAIDPQRVEALKTSFSDILKPEGDLVLSQALPEEANEPEILHLPRLVIDFNQRDFGRLPCLVDDINEA